MTLSLCSQLDLDFAVQKAANKAAKLRKAAGIEEPVETLLPASETLADKAAAAQQAVDDAPRDEDAFKAFDAAPIEPEAEEAPVDAESVFAKLKDLKPVLEEDGADKK